MEKLTIKELAPYLPYNLMVLNLHTNLTYQLTGRVIDRVANLNESHKPILRNLSDLTKEIEHNGEKFVPLDIICPKEEYSNEFDRSVAKGSIELQGVVNFSCTYFSIVQKLFEWHFDVFGLREKGLCIYYNEL